MAQLSDYTSLVPSANAGRPKFMALISAVTQCFTNQMNLVESLPAAFDLDRAVGAQLDAVAQWIGASRLVSTPIVGVYFEFDNFSTPVGFDQGIWFYKFSPSTGVSSLPDDSFRLLLRAKIAANNWQSDPATFLSILRTILSPATVSVTDNGNMTVTVSISGAPPSTLFRYVIEQGGLPIRPMGIQVTYSFS